MKSLVEEASSLGKAIEKAWVRAGMPQTFSVKVYETGEKNFLGFSKKSAKVGILFEEVQPKPERHHRNNHRPHAQSYTERLEQSSQQKPEHAEKRNHRTAGQRGRTHQHQERHEKAAHVQHHESHAKVERSTERSADIRVAERQVEQSPERPERKEFTRNSDQNNRQRRPQRPAHKRQSPHHRNTHEQHEEDLVKTHENNHAAGQEINKTSTHTQTTQQVSVSERPVISIASAQPQRKVLKSSSRRYSAQKPADTVTPHDDTETK